MNDNTQEKNFEIKNQSLGDFVDKLPSGYIGGETALSEGEMDQLAQNLKIAGKKELGNYSVLDAMGKRTKGVGTIVIDCATVEPQKIYSAIAENKKNGAGDALCFGSEEFYARRAYTMGITLEAFRQMLEYTKGKPKLRPENKEVTAHIEYLQKRISEYGYMNSDVNDSTHDLIPGKLGELSKSLGMEKFVLVLTNTQDIPQYVRDPSFENMRISGQGENKKRVMFLAKKETPPEG